MYSMIKHMADDTLGSVALLLCSGLLLGDAMGTYQAQARVYILILALVVVFLARCISRILNLVKENERKESLAQFNLTAYVNPEKKDIPVVKPIVVAEPSVKTENEIRLVVEDDSDVEGVMLESNSTLSEDVRNEVRETLQEHAMQLDTLRQTINFEYDEQLGSFCTKDFELSNGGHLFGLLGVCDATTDKVTLGTICLIQEQSLRRLWEVDNPGKPYEGRVQSDLHAEIIKKLQENKKVEVDN